MKKRFLRKTVFVTVMGIMLLAVSTAPVQADNLQQQLDQSQQQASQLKGNLNVQKSKVSVATTQVMALKQSVQALNDSMARDQALLNDEQNHLKDLEDQQQKLEDQRQEHIQALGQYLKSNYEDGVSSYFTVLFEATSLSDFIDRVDNVQIIVGTYGKLQQDIQGVNQSIDSQKGLIQQKQDTIQAAIQDKLKSQQAIQPVLDKQQAVLDQLSADEKVALNLSLNAQAKVSRVQQLIQQAALEATYAANGGVDQSSNNGGVAGTVKVSGGAQQVLSIAAKFLGTPYVWGGTNPSGFDCSGFTQYAFKQVGISISRTSEAQYNNGVAVSRSQLRPGDLVFYHTYSSGASHVGIYVGNNTMINSSNGGVSYDDMTISYWASRYLGARRVIAQ